ncbi:MAG: DUF6062 family protein [Actinomycetota bacterium]
MRGSIAQQAGYRDLLADLEHPGCPACRGSFRSARRYIGAVLWESVNDVGIRHRLRESQGFCGSHGQLAIKVAYERALATGMAVMYEDFLGHVERDLVVAVRRRRISAPVPESRCPACERADETTDSYLRILGEAREGDEIFERARLSGRFVCLPHVRIGLGAVDGREQAGRLIDLFTLSSNRTRRDLQEFVRKHDYRFHDEPVSEAERSAWILAVEMLTGESPTGSRGWILERSGRSQFEGH